jgi:DNA topoisomerase-1
MTYTLLIVESPAKCKKIEEYLGSGYKCIASFGHITELDGGLESIDIENNFAPRFKTVDSKEQQISKIKKAITQSSEVLLATDDDREGEAIAWHLCKTFDLNVDQTKRIIFHEITQPALQRAVSEPGYINIDLVQAQQSRQILDLLVGYRLSPLLWKNISKNGKTTLSAGRCQTPALRLVYDNQKEIDASPGKKVYNTTGYFTNENLPFLLDFDYEGEEQMTTFLENTLNFDHIYVCNPIKNSIKNPPTPFTTSAIQQAASNEFRISPKETMSICQKLYEGGYITYMRTDSTTYSKEFIDTAKTFIGRKYGDDYVSEIIDTLSERKEEKPSKKGKNSKKKTEEKKVAAQEAHEAIRPTNINIEQIPDDMDNKEKKIYKLIWTNTVESCMPPATYKSLTAHVTAPEEHKYKYSTEQVVFPGWKIVSGYEVENPTFVYLQTLKNNNVINYKKVVSKVSMKDMKQHFTEARLVQLLEQKGIGRPSTFSTLIDKIQERGYVKIENITGKKIACTDFELVDEELTENTTEREFGNEKNKLVIQPLGMTVIDFLIQNFGPLFNYDYTKYMEDILDKIAKGTHIWHELCRECNNQITELSEPLIKANDEESKSKVSEKISIKIDANNRYIIGKNGPVIMSRKKDKVIFKAVKKDLDLEKLKNGEYKLKDIVETNAAASNGKKLGEYEGDELFLKNGKYGIYVTWGEKSKNLKDINKPENEITLDDVVEYFAKTTSSGSTKSFKKSETTSDASSEKTSSIIRVLNENLSIRNGKYGDYIYYKTKAMIKPKFLDLKKYDDDYRDGDIRKLLKWITLRYEIK